MSSSKRHSRHVAHVEDCEDDSVEGNPETRKYAVNHEGAPISPPKERPNTSKSRSSEKRPPARSSASSSAVSQSLTDSESVSTSHSEEKERKAPSRPARTPEERERRRLPREEKPVDPRAERKAMASKPSKTATTGTKQPKQQRPAALRHAATQPEILQHSGYRRGHVEDPSCYGVTTQPAPPQKSRPRNARPVSYSAGVGAHPRPPIAHSGWHQTHQPGPPPFPVGTFPPPMFSSSPGPGSMAAPSPSSIGSQGYFDNVMGPQYHANLRNRFEGRDRPSSAMGFSQSPTARRMHHDEYENQPRINRRPSRSRRHDEEDRKMMPPPPPAYPRPKSAMPTTNMPFAAPPRPPSRPPSRPVPHKTPSRQMVHFAHSSYDDDDVDEGLFQDMSPEPNHDPRRKAMVRTRHMSGSFEPSEFSMLSPTSTRGTRLSRDYSNGPGGASLGIYGTSADYESRIHEAARYQEAAGGGQSMPLTAESLRANSRAVASSRSTRSSGSRGDDSDFKRSNTTGLTRISDGRSPDENDYIVKVSGAANIRFPGGAEIATEGGQITFSSRQGGALLRSDDSEVASTAYQLEDSYSRIEAPPQMKALPLPHRSRAPSQSDSRSLAYPAHAPYEPGLANYYYDDGRLPRDY